MIDTRKHIDEMIVKEKLIRPYPVDEQLHLNIEYFGSTMSPSCQVPL